MGDDPEPLTTGSPVQRREHRQILLLMLCVTVIAALVAAFAAGARASIGVCVGGLLAWLNYRWLDSSTRAIMVDPFVATTSILAMKYVFRYVVIAAVVFAIWWYNVLPVAAVIAGLASFAIAVVLQGLRSIFSSSL